MDIPTWHNRAVPRPKRAPIVERRIYIEDAMKARGWGQRDLADNTGLSLTAITDAINGRASTARTLKIIHDALEVDGSTIASGDTITKGDVAAMFEHDHTFAAIVQIYRRLNRKQRGNLLVAANEIGDQKEGDSPPITNGHP